MADKRVRCGMITKNGTIRRVCKNVILLKSCGIKSTTCLHGYEMAYPQSGRGDITPIFPKPDCKEGCGITGE